MDEFCGGLSQLNRQPVQFEVVTVGVRGIQLGGCLGDLGAHGDDLHTQHIRAEICRLLLVAEIVGQTTVACPKDKRYSVIAWPPVVDGTFMDPVPVPSSWTTHWSPGQRQRHHDVDVKATLDVSGSACRPS